MKQNGAACISSTERNRGQYRGEQIGGENRGGHWR
jgi:hypothetical protein